MKKTVNKVNQIELLFKLRKRMKHLQEVEEKLTQDALLHLEIYGTLREGDWSAVVNLIESKRPLWKEEFIKVLGQAKADKAIENTPLSICKRLIILNKGVKVA